MAVGWLRVFFFIPALWQGQTQSSNLFFHLPWDGCDFRKHFTVTGELAGLTLVASNLIDDGAIFYVNGQEVKRIAMPAGPVSWGTLATRNELITSVTHTYETFFIPLDAVIVGDNVIAVEVHQGSTTSSSLAFQTELWLHSAEAPVLGAQPISTTVLAGTNVTLSVSFVAGGDAAIQWFQNNSALPGETNQLIALTNIQLAQEGGYYVIASNSYGMVTSSVAGLNVVGGEARLRLLEFTNIWRFNQDGVDLGTSWRPLNYDDSMWPSGSGIFLQTPNTGFPEPTNQVLSLTNSSGYITTYYFRTHFTLPSGLTNIILLASNLLDDGAVFYINGAEAGRIRISGDVTGSSLAAISPSSGRSYEVIVLSSSNVVAGDNVLAVEVHQSSIGSLDVLFGMNLTAYGAFNQRIIILNPPSSKTIVEEMTATFSADIVGAQPWSVQWSHDGVPVDNATNLLFRINTAHPSDSGEYSFIVSNALNVITSSVASLTVIPETDPPRVVAAFATNGYTGVLAVFSEPISEESATNVSNFALSPQVSILTAERIAPNTVLLTTSGLGPQFEYTLRVTNVFDLADVPNVVVSADVPVERIRSSAAAGLRGVQTVFIILMEDEPWGNIKGNTNCPYINSLLSQASYCESYTSPNNLHPGEPNYIWLEGGQTFGYGSNSGPSIDRIASPNHLVTQLLNAGIEWRGYMENMPYGTTGTNDGPYEYVARHNPFAFFDDVTTNYPYCTNHVRPYAEFAGDLATGRIGRYNFLRPNRFNSMQELNVSVGSTSREKQGDDWLARELPQILNSAALSNNGAIFITFDENDHSENYPIPMVVLSPLAKGGGYASYVPYDHSSTLRTMEEIFRVRPYLAASADAQPLDDLFCDFSLTILRSNDAVSVEMKSPLVGQTHYLQASSDLQKWTPISTNVVTNVIVVPDPEATGAPQRFYRAVTHP